MYGALILKDFLPFLLVIIHLIHCVNIFSLYLEKDSMSNAEEFLDKSKSCFNEALQCFVKSNDRINAGMVLSNNGRLFRIWAHLLALHDAKHDWLVFKNLLQI